MKYKPMLCHIGKKDALSKKGWLYEIKLDGTRLILHKKNSSITLWNRKGTSKLAQYPELASLAKSIKPKDCVIDGELIVYDSKGMPSFSLFLKREQTSNQALIPALSNEIPATYVAFDMLEMNGRQITGLPIEERKKILEKSIVEGDNLQLIFSTEKGPLIWEEVRKRNVEGVIAKKLGTKYTPGQRSWDWLKIKNIKTADVVIVGFTSEKKAVSSLCMGLYKKEKLVYIGRVGTGFTYRIEEELHNKLEKLKTDKPHVINPPSDRKIRWVEPRLVAEVEYLNVTEDGQLRSASFKGLRADKPTRQCTWEQI